MPHGAQVLLHHEFVDCGDEGAVGRLRVRKVRQLVERQSGHTFIVRAVRAACRLIFAAPPGTVKVLVGDHDRRKSDGHRLRFRPGAEAPGDHSTHNQLQLMEDHDGQNHHAHGGRAEQHGGHGHARGQ